jgi:hypothetical protein
MAAVLRGLVLGLLVTLALWQASLAQSAPPAQSSPLNVLLTVDRFAYQPGEPITFTVRIQNVTNQTISVPFLTSQRFDVIIRSPFTEVDRWSTHQFFTQARVEQRWAPGEVITFTDTWFPSSSLLPGAAGSGPQLLARGLFQMQAEVASMSLRAVSPPIPIIIGWPTYLAPGCTQLSDLPTADLTADALARTVEPRDALRSLWQPSLGNGPYVAYSPRLTMVSNLRTIHQRAPVTVCVSGPAQITLP